MGRETKLAQVIRAAVQETRLQEQAQLTARRAVHHLEKLTQAYEATMQQLATAIATMEGQNCETASPEVDDKGMIHQVVYRRADGQEKTLIIHHPGEPGHKTAASKIWIPN